MIGFLRGDIDEIYDDRVVLDTGTIGYNVFVPGNVSGQLSIGDEVKLYTYLSVREDAMNLFGFLNKDDLDMYKLLITVNGIGPKAALSIMTMLSTEEICYAIMTNDSKMIAKAQGVGAKTAQKVILELKDKIGSFNVSMSDSDAMEVMAKNTITENANEAIMTLVALGYSKDDSEKAVKKCDLNETTENIVKQALQTLM